MKIGFTKMKILFVFIVFLFFSCQKDEKSGYFELGKNEIEMNYQETQCSDPWYELVILHQDRSKKAILKEYLDLKKIKYLDMVYDKASSDEVISCTACTCFTGSVFYIKIKDKSDNIEKLKEIGFKL